MLEMLKIKAETEIIYLDLSIAVSPMLLCTATKNIFELIRQTKIE